MKPAIIITLCLFIWVSDLPGQTKRVFYVAAPSGLSLRKEPNKDSEKLALIPYGIKLDSVLYEHGYPKYFNSTTIDGYEDDWIKVYYNKKWGFVFLGYVLPLEPPPVQRMSLDSYLAKVWGNPNYIDSFPNSYRFDNGYFYGTNDRFIYRQGGIHLIASLEEAAEESLINVDMSLQQAYLWYHLMELYVFENTRPITTMHYPLVEIKNDSLTVRHFSKDEFLKGQEMEIHKVDGYVHYLRIFVHNGRVTIIWGSHI